MEPILPPAPAQTNEPVEYGLGMDLRVLGPIEAVEDGRRLPLGEPKQRTVLALLIVNSGRLSPDGTMIVAQQSAGGVSESIPSSMSVPEKPPS